MVEIVNEDAINEVMSASSLEKALQRPAERTGSAGRMSAAMPGSCLLEQNVTPTEG